MEFQGCHNLIEVGYQQWTWPDGLPLREQTQLTVQAFRIIREQGMEALKRSREAAKHGTR